MLTGNRQAAGGHYEKDKTVSDFKPRYDEERGIYRDCPYCQGEGCPKCPEEADAEYKRQFPDGPKPIATFENTTEGATAAGVFLQEIIRLNEEEANHGL